MRSNAIVPLKDGLRDLAADGSLIGNPITIQKPGLGQLTNGEGHDMEASTRRRIRRVGITKRHISIWRHKGHGDGR